METQRKLASPIPAPFGLPAIFDLVAGFSWFKRLIEKFQMVPATEVSIAVSGLEARLCVPATPEATAGPAYGNTGLA